MATGPLTRRALTTLDSVVEDRAQPGSNHDPFHANMSIHSLIHHSSPWSSVHPFQGSRCPGALYPAIHGFLSSSDQRDSEDDQSPCSDKEL